MTRSALLYLIGGPGTGKSTVLNGLLGDPIREESQPFKHRIYASYPHPGGIQPGGIQLGGSRSEFPGTDTLQLNVQPLVTSWMREQPAGTMVAAEGARLANHIFFDAVESMGWALHLFYLWVAPDELQRRRALRSQNPTWVKGQDTKMAKLFRQRRALHLENTTPGQAACALAQHSVVRAIRGEAQ